MWEFIHKPGEEDKYKRVAKNLSVDIGFRYEHGKFYARVNHCSIKDFTRELQRVIQEESEQWHVYTSLDDSLESLEVYQKAAAEFGVQVKVERNDVLLPDSISRVAFYMTVKRIGTDMRLKCDKEKKGYFRTLMTPEDVRRRLDAGEDPLMVSIDHWMENVRWMREGKTLPGNSFSEETCALCTAHRYHDFRKSACSKCVLYQATGLACPDNGSPWITFYDNRTLSNAIVMLNALLSCLEYTPEPEKQFYIWQEGCEPEGKVGLEMSYETDGSICVIAHDNGDNDETYTLMFFNQDGSVIGCAGLPKRLGFHLTHLGELEID